MKPTSTIAFVSIIVLAGTAMAGPAAQAATAGHWTDADYLTASHCAGLAQGSKISTANVDSALKDQEAGRAGFIADKADELRSDAQRKAADATGSRRKAIDAEIAGRCQAFLGAPTAIQARQGS